MVRPALTRVDREDSENLPEVMADAILFGQCVESRVLGVTLPDPEKFPAGVQAALSRAIGNVELWTPVIRSLTTLLLRDGRVTASAATLAGLTTGDRLGGPGRQRLEDYELSI